MRVLSLSLALNWVLLQSMLGHPHNVSSGTATWIEDTQSLEVALQVSVEDLETVLIEQLKLDGKPGIAEKELRKYVETHLRVQRKDKTRVKSKWIGYEVDDAIAWIYVEFSFGKPSMKDCTLINTLLIDAFDQQTNLINVTRGKQRKTLLFRKRHRERLLPGW